MGLNTLLCFGDSNTWGFNPATGERHPIDIRWPGVLRHKLGDGYGVIEDGLNGRTAVGGNPFTGLNDSKTDLGLTLASHCSLDLVILMLGTNDLLMRFSTSPCDVGEGIDVLLEIIHHSGAGPGGSIPAILLLAPPPIGLLAGETEALDDAVAQSHLFAERYMSIATEFGCAFLDAGEVVRSSEIDGFHLEASAHMELGLAVAKRVRILFAEVE